MPEIIDFEALAESILVVLRSHGLTPDRFGISITVPRDEFDVVASQNPGHHSDLILIVRENDWYFQIKPPTRLEDFPSINIPSP